MSQPSNYELRDAVAACDSALTALRTHKAIPATMSDYRTIEGARNVMNRIADDMSIAEAAALAKAAES